MCCSINTLIVTTLNIPSLRSFCDTNDLKYYSRYMCNNEMNYINILDSIDIIVPNTCIYMCWTRLYFSWDRVNLITCTDLLFVEQRTWQICYVTWISSVFLGWICVNFLWTQFTFMSDWHFAGLFYYNLIINRLHRGFTNTNMLGFSFIFIEISSSMKLLFRNLLSKIDFVRKLDILMTNESKCSGKFK